MTMHPVVIRKLFRISLISVIGSSDKVGGLPKRGIEKKTTSDQWQQVDVIDSLKNVWYLAFQSLTVSQANFLVRINFFRLFSSSWNTIFPCWNNNTLSNLFRNYLKFFLTFCCSSRVLSSLATHTWEVLLNLIWLNARLSKVVWWHMSGISDIHISLHLQAKHKAKTKKKFLLKGKSSSFRETLKRSGHWRCSVKSCSSKFRIINRNTPVQARGTDFTFMLTVFERTTLQFQILVPPFII